MPWPPAAPVPGGKPRADVTGVARHEPLPVRSHVGATGWRCGPGEGRAAAPARADHLVHVCLSCAGPQAGSKCANWPWVKVAPRPGGGCAPSPGPARCEGDQESGSGVGGQAWGGGQATGTKVLASSSAAQGLGAEPAHPARPRPGLAGPGQGPGGGQASLASRCRGQRGAAAGHSAAGNGQLRRALSLSAVWGPCDFSGDDGPVLLHGVSNLQKHRRRST